MRARLRKPLSVLLSLVMVLTMCTGFSSAAFASSGKSDKDIAAEEASVNEVITQSDDPTDSCTYEGNGTADSPYIIKKAAQLSDMQTQVADGITFEGKYFKLGNDIDASSLTTLSIGDYQYTFRGNFDGANFTIKLGIDKTADEYWEDPRVGLFGRAYKATFSNLNLSGSVAGPYYVGSLIGYANECVVENCTSRADVYSNTGYSGILGAGGLVGGVVDGGLKMSNCEFTGTLNALFKSDTGMSYTNFGGLVGVVFNSAKNTVISDCSNEGTIGSIPSSGGVGGIVGKVYQSEVCIEDCFNEADLCATGNASTQMGGIGGIVGYFSGYKTNICINRCYNTGTITGREANYAFTGGICGRILDGSSGEECVIEECYNTGTVTSGGGSTGGIVGYAQGKVTSCYNTGNVTNAKESPTASYNANAGGICGSQAEKDTYITKCYNIGTVECTAETKTYAFAGGIIGQIATTSIDSSYIHSNRYLVNTASLGIGSITPDYEVCSSFEKTETADLLDAIGKTYQADITPNVNNGYPILRWQNPDAHYSASFSVKDKETGIVLRDATVEVAGQQAQADGDYELSPGEYKYTISREGYETVTKSFTIERKSLDFEIELTSIKHDYKVTVKPANAKLTVKNDGGAPAVAEPTVKKDADNNTATYTYSLADKAAYGTYTLSLSCYTYDKKDVTLEATGKDDETSVTMTKLPTSTFTFNVEPTGATVYVTNTEYGEQTTATSIVDGTQTFNLIDGSYTYKVKANGYESVSGSFTIPATDSSISVTLQKKDTWDGTSTDTDWYTWHPLTDVYEITSPDELAGLASLVNSGTDFSGKTINLMNDLDLGGIDKHSWVSIGNNNYSFNGTFIGGDHVIKNMYINITGSAGAANGYRGLFGKTNGATISDLTFENTVITTSTSTNYQFVGGLVGMASSTTINNIVLNGSITIPSSSAYTGGIAGRFDGTISDCVNNMNISSGYQVGGIIGTTYTNEGSLIIRCVNNGTIDAEKSGDTKTYAAGGIAGELYKKNDVIRFCVNYGTITGVIQSMGGILGVTSPSYTGNEIDSCYNLGTLNSTKTDSHVGGVVGYVHMGSTSMRPSIHNCYSACEISGSDCIGGVVGYQNSASVDSGYLYKNFYLANSKYKGSNTSSGAFEDEAFSPFDKSESCNYKDLIADLGDAYCSDEKSGDSYVYNGGYPVLRWQNPNAKFVVNFDISYDDKSNLDAENELQIVVKNSDGEVAYSGSDESCELRNGSYTYTIDRKGYLQASGKFSIAAAAAEVPVTLTAQKYNYVVNIDSSVTFSLAKVTEDGNVAITNPTYTDASGEEATGHYTFELVNGTYSYTAKKVGYEKETGEFDISYSAGSMTVTLSAKKTEKVKFNISPVSGSFKGTDPSISIYFKGGDFDGSLLNTYDNTSQISEGILFPEGDYTYIIKANGFAKVEGEFSVEKGSPVTIEKTMQIKDKWEGDSDVDTDWYTDYPGETTYTLRDESELAGLAKLVNEGTETFAGKTILLGQDMNLADNAWTPIGGYGAGSFEGTFDGQGCKIVFKNAQFNSSETTFGVFGWVQNATIKNVILEGNAYVNYTEEKASYGLFYMGALTGYAYNSTITNCSNQMTFNITFVNEAGSALVNCGGLVGWGVGVTLNSCNNIAAVKASVTGVGVAMTQLGGLVGYCNNSGYSGNILNCYNTGNISGTALSSNDGSAISNVGGLHGALSAASSYCTMQNCYNAGMVTSTGATTQKAYALIGSLTNSANFSNNFYVDNGLAETSPLSAKRTSDVMKSASFVTELGSAYAANSNGGYPILSWEKSIDHIVVTKMPSKTEYNDLESFDDSGMEITAYLSEDESEAVKITSGWTIVNGSSLAATQKTVAVEYKGATVEVPITVNQIVHYLSSSNLSLNIEAPKTGGTPQKEITLNKAQNGKFTAQISWTCGGKEFSGSFEDATFYRAHVVLTSHYVKDDVYYAFERGAYPSVDGSMEIRNYKQTTNDDKQYSTIEFDVTFAATSNASEDITESLLHLYYDGDQNSGSQYASALNKTLSIQIGDKTKKITVRELEQKVLEDGIGIQAEYAGQTYAGIYLYELLAEYGLTQDTDDKTIVTFTGANVLSRTEITLGDIRQQEKEEGPIVAFGDGKLGAPLAAGQGPLKMIQKEAADKSQANLSSIVIESPTATTTEKLTFGVHDTSISSKLVNNSITVKDAYGHVMTADEGTYGLEYTLRDGETYTYRVTREGYTVVSGSVKLKGSAQEVDVTLNPVWDGETLTEPQKDSSGYYLIGTAEELMWWHENYSASDKVKLTADIALNDGETNKNNWYVLGTNSGYGSGTLAFAGIFDGQGHVIRNFSIDRENLYELEVAWDGSPMAYADRISEIGFFGYTAGNATIKNLGIEGSINVFDRPDSTLADWMCVGGIVGFAQGNTKISNCYTNVSIKAVASLETDTIGGYPVAGYGYVCDNYIGGIAGSLSSTSSVTDCYSKGTYISAETRRSTMGGIVGVMRYTGTSVSNCYSTASLESKPLSTTTSDSYVGGIVGNGSWNPDQPDGAIKNCYALNTSIKALDDHVTVGKIAGKASESAISGNYALDDMRISAGVINTGEGEATLNGASITAANAKKASSYSNWNTDNWKFDESSYPALKWQTQAAGEDKTTSYIGQNITTDGDWDGYFGSLTPPPYFNIYVKVKGHDSVIAKSFSKEDMQNMAASDNEGTLYYSAFGYGTAGRVVKEYVYLDTLFSTAGVDFKSGDYMTLGYYNYSYDGLMKDRYYFPEWGGSGSEEGAVKVKPILALKSYGASQGVSKDYWNYLASQMDYLYAYMLVYGQTSPTDITYTYFMYQQTESTINYKAEVQANSTIRSLLTDAVADAQIVADSCFVSTDGTDVSSAYFYTDQETKDTFVAALSSAKETLNDDTATNDEVMTAYENVKDAQKRINKVKKQGLGVNRTMLKTAIDSAQALADNVVITNDGSSISEDRNWATQEAVDGLNASIKVAQTAYELDPTSQVELDQAYADLVEALESFAYGKGTLEAAERDAFVKELNEYVDALNMNDYGEDEQAQIKSLLKTYTKKIERASEPYISYDMMKEAKAAIDAVKTKQVIEQEELEAARTQAKESLNKYLDLSTLDREDRAVIQDIINEYVAKLDSAAKSEIDGVVEQGKAAIDAQKAKIDAAAAAAELEKARTEAKDTLNNYLDLSQMSREDRVLIQDVISEYAAKIDVAAKDEIDAVVAAGKTAIDAQKAAIELTAAKASAKDSLNSYLDLSELTREEKLLVEDVINEYAAKIDAAAAGEIETIVAQAKVAIDAEKASIDANRESTSIEQARTQAIDALEENYANLDLYYEAEQNKLTKAVLTNVRALKKAASKDEIAQVLEAAQNEIAAIPTKVIVDNTPAAVSGVGAKSASYQSVTVSWKADAKAKFYEVYRSTSANGEYTLVVLTSKTSFTNTSLTCGTTYYYKVRAYGMNNDTKLYGDYSSAVKAAPALGKVSISKVKASGKKKVEVTWKKLSGASGYQVYCATAKSGKYKCVKTLKSGSTKKFTNKKLNSGKKYYYKVRAYRTVGGKNIYGSFSGVKFAKAK